MEDRNTPGLYLEMTTQAPEAYEEQRVPRLLAQAGVQRATWWENVVPDRTDLPRELDEFSLLGLYEVDDTFRAPDAAAETTSHHFRRYPRPAQGCLSGRPTIGLSLVLISPRRPEEAQALRDWADFVHIRHIAETGNPGYTMITPYENVTGGDPRFMHLYEIDTDDPEGAFRAMTPRVIERLGGGFGTPAFDAWAFHDALRIMYVNSFRRLGARLA
ncbi:MAG: hypothetical protein E6G06_18470 [Actinobacteria bacterium]|nr:MAG: hypothetical protein E6G06_18470 [Actinomycetota bacterium]